jgi:hypothetical protein
MGITLGRNMVNILLGSGMKYLGLLFPGIRCPPGYYYVQGYDVIGIPCPGI